MNNDKDPKEIPVKIVEPESTHSVPETFAEVGQPIIPMNNKKRNDIPWIWALLGGCGCCFFLSIAAILFTVLILGGVIISSKDVLAQVENMCKDLNNNLPIEKYFTTSAQNSLEGQNQLLLENELTGCSTVTNIQTLDNHNNNGVQSFTLKGNLKYNDGSTRSISALFIKEEGIWKFDNISLGN